MTVESCWRCAAAMEWRHGTWQCPRCRFKLGCCEGHPQTDCEASGSAPEHEAGTVQPAASSRTPLG